MRPSPLVARVVFSLLSACLVLTTLPGRSAAADTGAAEAAVFAAESDPSKVAAAKDLVTAAIGAAPALVAPRLLEARLLAVEAKGKKTAQRTAAYGLVFEALDKASALDRWDPAPFRLKADVMRAMGTPDSAAYAEALRAAAIRSANDPVPREAYVRHTGKIPRIVAGDPLPRVTWKDGAGNDVASTSLYEKGPVVIELFRSAVWCPFCQRHLVLLHDNRERLEKEGLSVVACSPDTSATLLKIETEGLKDRKPYRVRLLSDPEGRAADRFGLRNADTIKPGTAPDAFGLPFPTTLVVDAKGIIRFLKTHGDLRDRVKPEELITVAKKLRTETSDR